MGRSRNGGSMWSQINVRSASAYSPCRAQRTGTLRRECGRADADRERGQQLQDVLCLLFLICTVPHAIMLLLRLQSYRPTLENTCSPLRGSMATLMFHVMAVRTMVLDASSRFGSCGVAWQTCNGMAVAEDYERECYPVTWAIAARDRNRAVHALMVRRDSSAVQHGCLRAGNQRNV